MADSLRPGAYDQLVTQVLAEQLKGLPAERVLREALEAEAAPDVLAQHLRFLFRRALKAISVTNDSVERIQLSNNIVRALSEITDDLISADDLIEESSSPVLWGIRPDSISDNEEMESPSVRLSESALLVNGRNQPSIGHEINKELTSADNVDLLCSFVMNTGINILEKNLRRVVERGGRIRVLTTTYMGATQRKAIDRLTALGAEVRISYDATTTRLHAKAWLLRRYTGATTAYIGSSNLSKAALTDGIEWNVRVAAREQDHIVESMSATFEDYWNDPEFEAYDSARDAERLDHALSREGISSPTSLSLSFANIEVSPRPFQQEVLESLTFQRDVWGRRKNLVAMATGTGKTVVAGLDFRRLFETGEVKSLLFVAHRKEILDQSLITFRTILRDGTFGELFVDGQRPTTWSHVFGSIQSLNAMDLDSIGPDHFDMVIVDEFHHAAADSYEKLLSRLEPKYLLGLTATPERSDGKPILHWFDNTISAELRLWEAIDRQILSPFQYFGIHDNTDLSAAGIKWTRGQGYDVQGLTNLYTANDSRVALILEQMNKYIDDLASMKAIGFCVSIEHAEYMARKFNEVGIPSVAITSKLHSEERTRALLDLRTGVVRAVFAVDVFNEGVDIPDVNTILMLRPTESATIFLQQLGRGLRKSELKNCLIVLDFVGNQNKEFRFDKKYGALLGVGRQRLSDEVDHDFPHLPVGCHIELDRVAKRIVLDNLKQSLKLNKSYLSSEIRNLGEVTTAEFFESTGISLQDFYCKKHCLTELRQAIFGGETLSVEDMKIAHSIRRLIHVDDLERLEHYIALVEGMEIDIRDRKTMMLAHVLFPTGTDEDNARARLSQMRSSLVAREIADVLRILIKNRPRTVIELPSPEIPLNIHATYSRPEILAAFGRPVTGKEREGALFVKESNADVAFVTLNKTTEHFSAQTMYADTALSAYIFQWESQVKVSEGSPTGKRYVHHLELGSTFHLFVRDWPEDPETKKTMPFMYFGPAKYLSHEGSRPMRIRWHLNYPIPTDVLMKSKVIAS
jgi:superfamily II DNA or RNA helicase